ncbi:MAG: hypothetical protein JEY99_06020 [Spirochaetales bacterium]|nr:hypothetical protein [Spirochaetales bacterium]
MNTEIIRLRSAMNRTIRAFFDSRNYLEVDTPLLSPDLIPESAIDIFKTRFESGHNDAQEFYLIPSPEIWMKKLLSQGSGSIYQICRSFRNREQRGRLHNPEFTMLEWYETGADYWKSIETTEALFRELAPLSGDSTIKNTWSAPFRRMSMEEAFREYTGEEISPWCKPGEEGMAALLGSLEKLGHTDYTPQSWEEGFNLIFVHQVEPSLPQERPLILFDYPANIPTLAANKKDSPWSERWELYIGGCELANCYTEETAPEKVKEYYGREAPFKTMVKKPGEIHDQKQGPILHKVDKGYHRFFHPDFPGTSGVAMGMDRLLMLMGGKANLQGVILFPFSDIFDRN